MSAAKLDIERGLREHMARARRNGCHPDGVIRAGKLYLAGIERKLEHAKATEQFSAAVEHLESLGPEGKAAGTKARIELLEKMLEQVSLHPRIQGNGIHGGGKAFAGLAREKRRSLRRFIEDIGGYTPDGGYANDLLDFDGEHVERAMLLIRGEADPETDDERDALKRWREKHPISTNPEPQKGTVP